jgi:hypothetical protein
MILAIDFDGVIHDRDHPLPGKRMGMPIAESQEAMRKLRRSYKLIVHTVMATNESGKLAVENWLRSYNIPFDEVTAIKPNADVYLDNKAIRFKDWGSALTDIRKAINGRL